MSDIIMTSSVLISIILLIRAIFKNIVSSRLIYSLWLLVAIRLLVPNLEFETSINFPKTINQVEEVVGVNEKVEPTIESPTIEPTVESNINNVISSEPQTSISYTEISRSIWILGTCVSLSYFIIINSKLRASLLKKRHSLNLESYELPVYVVDNLQAPCLYGLFKPSIYLTTSSLESEVKLDYIMRHELTHYRQLDHVWSIIRIICLCIYWFNPLVWIAVYLSKKDSELACDEGVLAKLNKEEQKHYGKVLIEMVNAPIKMSNLFYSTSFMSGGSGEMKERIKKIATNKKMLTRNFIILTGVVLITILFTFGTSGTLTSEDGGIEVKANGISQGVIIYNDIQEIIPKDYYQDVLQLLELLPVETAEATLTTHMIKLVADDINYLIGFNDDFTVASIKYGEELAKSYTISNSDEIKKKFVQLFEESVNNQPEESYRYNGTVNIHQLSMIDFIYDVYDPREVMKHSDTVVKVKVTYVTQNAENEPGSATQLPEVELLTELIAVHKGEVDTLNHVYQLDGKVELGGDDIENYQDEFGYNLNLGRNYVLFLHEVTLGEYLIAGNNYGIFEIDGDELVSVMTGRRIPYSDVLEN